LNIPVLSTDFKARFDNNADIIVISLFPVSKKYFPLAIKFFTYKMGLCRYMHLLGGKFIQFSVFFIFVWR
jgi:hypothetical protein